MDYDPYTNDNESMEDPAFPEVDFLGQAHFVTLFLCVTIIVITTIRASVVLYRKIKEFIKNHTIAKPPSAVKKSPHSHRNLNLTSIASDSEMAEAPLIDSSFINMNNSKHDFYQSTAIELASIQESEFETEDDDLP